MKFEIVKGSVVNAPADAIVNAANNWLSMGGGVCGAIFESAGISELTAACQKIGRCETGSAVITDGFGLKAKYIIHAVGPIYSGTDDDAKLLASCYNRCLKLADEHKCKTLAFCCISTGIYGYPLDEATQIAIRQVTKYIPKTLEKVYFYCFNEREYETYTFYKSKIN